MKRRGCRIAVILAVLVPLLLVSPFVISPIRHNMVLARFSAQLEHYPPPEGASVIDRGSTCGKLSGNGNGMDFAAAVVLRSDAGAGAVEAHYAAADFRPAMGQTSRQYGGESPPRIIVEEIFGDTLHSPYIEHSPLRFDLPADATDGGYYAVLLYDNGYYSGFDIRGH